MNLATVKNMLVPRMEKSPRNVNVNVPVGTAALFTVRAYPVPKANDPSLTVP